LPRSSMERHSRGSRRAGVKGRTKKAKGKGAAPFHFCLLPFYFSLPTANGAKYPEAK
jgi:hypothetical protein